MTNYSILQKRTSYILKIIIIVSAALGTFLYAIYAGIGYILGWQFAEGITYPYFFLNWGSPAGAFGFSDELPFMGCMWWIIAIFVFLILLALLYLWILDLLKKNRK